MTRSRESGVYYAVKDVAGFWARTAAMAIDLTVVAIGAAILYSFGDLLGVARWLVTIFVYVSAWAYLAVLKAGPRGSLGYRALKLRLVSLQGEQASLLQSSMRVLFVFYGPINVLVDFLWLTTDPRRQTVRDKLSTTYVIRRDALPVETRPIHYPTYFIAGLSLVVAEVVPVTGTAHPK